MPVQVQWLICFAIAGSLGILIGTALSGNKVEKLETRLKKLTEQLSLCPANWRETLREREGLVDDATHALRIETVKREAAERLHAQLERSVDWAVDLWILTQKVQGRRLKLLQELRSVDQSEIRSLRKKLEIWESSKKPGDILVLRGTGPGSAADEMARMEGRG